MCTDKLRTIQLPPAISATVPSLTAYMVESICRCTSSKCLRTPYSLYFMRIKDFHERALASRHLAGRDSERVSQSVSVTITEPKSISCPCTHLLV